MNHAVYMPMVCGALVFVPCSVPPSMYMFMIIGHPSDVGEGWNWKQELIPNWKIIAFRL